MNEEANVQNTTSETAISSESETQQENVTETAPETQPEVQEASGNTTASAQEGANPVQEDAPFLEIKYMKEMKGLTREQAKDLCEKGMHYGALHDKLDYIAAQKDTTVDALIDGIMQSMEDAKRAELKERFGDDDSMIEDLMTLYRNGQKEKYDKVVADRKSASEQAAAEKEKSLNERISDEFIAMKKDFPELTDYASLPAQVRQAAADGMPLPYAYLMYKHTEAQKVATAQQQAAEAAQKSSGSLSTGTQENNSGIDDAVIAGIWSR